MKHFTLIAVMCSLLAIPLVIAVTLGVDYCCRDIAQSAGYRESIATGAHAGRWILGLAITVFVIDMAMLTVHTLRHAEPDAVEGKSVTEGRPLPLSLGIPPPLGRSRRKMLVSRSNFVTMKSLVDGTATSAQRWVVAGIITAAASFFLIFVGAALALMEQSLIGLLFVTIPGLFFYDFVTTMWAAYRKARSGSGLVDEHR